MNLDRINALTRELLPSSIVEMEVEEPGLRLRVRRARVAPAAAKPQPAETGEPPHREAEPELVWIEAGLVGVFRAADPPIREGQRLSAGQEVGVIESMRVPNPVRTERAGRVVEVAVADGFPVEYGQPLFGLVPE